MSTKKFALLLVLSVNTQQNQTLADEADMMSISTFEHVVSAFEDIVTRRTLKSDDGCLLVFGAGQWSSSTRFQVPYKFVFANGRSSSGREVVSDNGLETIVNQIVKQVLARSYFASVEGPFRVLRIRPIKPETSEFISRDCVRKSDEEGTICYNKVRYMNDVIVSVFREKYSSKTN